MNMYTCCEVMFCSVCVFRFMYVHCRCILAISSSNLRRLYVKINGSRSNSHNENVTFATWNICSTCVTCLSCSKIKVIPIPRPLRRQLVLDFLSTSGRWTFDWQAFLLENANLNNVMKSDKMYLLE